MKYLFLLLTLIMVSSCESNEKKLFFDFDEVDYYKVDQKKESEYYEKERENRNEKDTVFDKIYYDDFPVDLKDTLFLSKIKSDRFNKIELAEEDKKLLKTSIFKKRLVINPFKMVRACAPIFNDILIFKKNNRISGIAKICLSCEQFYFIGNKPDVQTENFGEGGEYDKLKEIFHKYK